MRFRLVAVSAGLVVSLELLAPAAGATSDSQMPALQSIVGVSCSSARYCVVATHSTTGVLPYSTMAIVREDSERQWSYSHVVASDRIINAVECESQSKCVAAGRVGSRPNSKGLIAVSSNGGSKWRFEPDQHGFAGTAIACAHSERRCIISGGFIRGRRLAALALYNRGTEQFPMIPKQSGILALVSCSMRHCVSVGPTYSRVMISTNGGRKWSSVSAGASWFSAAIACGSPKKCNIGGVTGISRNSLMLHSNDGGKNWSEVSSPLPARSIVSDMSCNRTTCVAIGALGAGETDVVVSADGGQSWSFSPTFRLGRMQAATCISPSTCLLFGTRAGRANRPISAVSTDGGLSWSSSP